MSIPCMLPLPVPAHCLCACRSFPAHCHALCIPHGCSLCATHVCAPMPVPCMPPVLVPYAPCGRPAHCPYHCPACHLCPFWCPAHPRTCARAQCTPTPVPVPAHPLRLCLCLRTLHTHSCAPLMPEHCTPPVPMPHVPPVPIPCPAHPCTCALPVHPHTCACDGASPRPCPLPLRCLTHTFRACPMPSPVRPHAQALCATMCAPCVPTCCTLHAAMRVTCVLEGPVYCSFGTRGPRAAGQQVVIGGVLRGTLPSTITHQCISPLHFRWHQPTTRAARMREHRAVSAILATPKLGQIGPTHCRIGTGHLG